MQPTKLQSSLRIRAVFWGYAYWGGYSEDTTKLCMHFYKQNVAPDQNVQVCRRAWAMLAAYNIRQIFADVTVLF
jgi:hypothetical protein